VSCWLGILATEFCGKMDDMNKKSTQKKPPSMIRVTIFRKQMSIRVLLRNGKRSFQLGAKISNQ